MTLKNASSRRELNLIIVILYKVIVDFFFFYCLSERYSYCGSGADPNLFKLIISWVMALVLWYLFEQIRGGDLKLIIGLLYLLSVVPTVTIYWLKNENNVAFFLIMIYWIVFGVAGVIITRTRQYDAIKNFDVEFVWEKIKDNKIIDLLFVYLIVTTLYFSYKYGGGRLFIRFEDVYKYRLDVGNYMSTIEGYIFSWNTIVFLPIVFSFHLLCNKKIYIIIDCLLFLLNYSIYGNKIIFFTMLAELGVFILKKCRILEKMNNFIMFGLSGIMACVFWGRKVLPKIYSLVYSIIYRLLFIPAEAHFYYYDFFEENPYLYLRQSVLRHFFDDPYDNAVSIIIGSSKKYNLVGSYNNLNNGLFSDAYSNFGVLGIIVYPIILVCTFCVLEKVLCCLDESVRYALYIVITMNFVSAGYFQQLLSGGIVLLGIVVCAISKINLTASRHQYKIKGINVSGTKY